MSATNKIILVTGATGHIGGELARILDSSGNKVRALVRNSDRAKDLPTGIERVMGDLNQPETL